MDKDDWLGQSHTFSGEFEPMGGKLTVESRNKKRLRKDSTQELQGSRSSE